MLGGLLALPGVSTAANALAGGVETATAGLDSAISVFQSLISNAAANTASPQTLLINGQLAGSTLQQNLEVATATAADEATLQALATSTLPTVEAEKNAVPDGAILIPGVQNTDANKVVSLIDAVENTISPVDAALTDSKKESKNPTDVLLGLLAAQQAVPIEVTEPVAPIAANAAPAIEGEASDVVPLYLQSAKRDQIANEQNILFRFAKPDAGVPSLDDANITTSNVQANTQAAKDVATQIAASGTAEIKSDAAALATSTSDVAKQLLAQLKDPKSDSNKSGSVLDLFSRNAVVMPVTTEAVTLTKNLDMEANANKNQQTIALLHAKDANAPIPVPGDDIAPSTQTLTQNSSMLAGADSSFSHVLAAEHMDAPHKAGGDTLNASFRHYPTPAEQLHMKIASAANNGESKITVQLDPAHLGKVDVQIDMNKDGKISLMILADRSDTLQQLQKDSGALVRMLQDAGIQADAGSMQFDLRGQHQQQAWNHANDNSGSNRTNNIFGGNAIGASAIETLTQYHLQTDGMVNIVV